MLDGNGTKIHSAAPSITGGELVSTGVVKWLGACRGVGPR